MQNSSKRLITGNIRANLAQIFCSRGGQAMPVLVLAILIAIVDQGIKYYVQSTMKLGMSIPVIHETFHFTYILNPGAAFGILQCQTKFFVAIAIIMLAALVYLYRHIAAGPWLLRLGVGLLAGGALGNSIDRMRTGYVVDYLDFHIWPVCFIPYSQFAPALDNKS